MVHLGLKAWEMLQKELNTSISFICFDLCFRKMKQIVLSLWWRFVRLRNIFIRSPNVRLNIIFLCTKQHWISQQAFLNQTFSMSGWFWIKILYKSGILINYTFNIWLKFTWFLKRKSRHIKKWISIDLGWSMKKKDNNKPSMFLQSTGSECKTF